MIERRIYLDKIIEFIDKPFVKVLTGIRRSGKSTVLLMITQVLQKQGVETNQIIYINLESFANAHLDTPQALYQYVTNIVPKGKRCYLLVDEIQEIMGWEKAINSLNVDYDIDIYITGSNSHLLSSELATFLAGRYIEFHIYPLSFEEYLQDRKSTRLNSSHT